MLCHVEQVRYRATHLHLGCWVAVQKDTRVFIVGILFLPHQQTVGARFVAGNYNINMQGGGSRDVLNDLVTGKKRNAGRHIKAL